MSWSGFQPQQQNTFQPIQTQTMDFPQLMEFSEAYLNTSETPFKLVLSVTNSQQEKDYYKSYRDHLENEKKKTDTNTQTTNGFDTNSFGNNNGFGFGGTGNNPFGFGTQTQTQTTLQGYTENGNKATMELYFFDGLEHRLKHQQEQQIKMKEKLSKISEDIKSIMNEIETQILSKYNQLQKKALEIDKKIVSKLSESGKIDKSLVANFRDLNRKMESNDLNRKTDQLLNMLQNKKVIENQNQQGLDEHSQNEVLTLLSKQQELILKFVGEINDLQGKYQNLKSTLASLNESK